MSYHWRCAPAEARALGLNFVGSDHLLLAILRSDRTVAGRALAECGVRHDEAHQLVETWYAETDRGPVRRRRMHSPRVRRLARVARVLARLGGRRLTSDVDMLIALMYEDGGPHGSVLRSLGSARAEVVNALRRNGVPVPVAPPIPEGAEHSVSLLVPAEHGRAVIDVLEARMMLDPDRYMPFGRSRWGFNYTRDPAVWVFSADAELGLPQLVEKAIAHANTG